MIKKTILGLNSLMFIAFGFGFIIDPVSFTPLFLGVSAPQGDLLIDMRATYGGFSLCVGLLMLFGVIKEKYFKASVFVAFLSAFSVFVGRSVGMATAAGDVGQMMYQSLVLELFLSVFFGAMFFLENRGKNNILLRVF
ncbi:MAG: DUF4345 domain-containing protein [Proteobacteria bacterium]|nr:DUF4345 domain-containing protein [Pseudomonadota bacterium]